MQAQLNNVQQIQASHLACAALTGDGCVVTWGDAQHGGDCGAVQDRLKNVQQVPAHHVSFSAVRGDGSVVTWGDPRRGGGRGFLGRLEKL